MAGSTKKGAPSSADQPPTGKKQLALRIEALAAASARLESRSDGLRRDLSRVDQAQSELATTAARLVGELDALARRSAGLEQNLREVSEANGELSRQIAQGPVSHPEVDRRLQEMEAGLEALAGRQGEVGPGLADLERRLASFEAAYSGLGEQAEALRARVEGLVSSGDVLQSVDASLGEIRAELDHLIRRLAAMEAADAQDTALLALEDRLGALERGLEDLAALGQVQESQGGELAGLGKRLESLGQAIHETTELIGQEAGKLAEVQARMQGDARTLEDLGAAQADDRDMLHGLTTRLDAQDAERGRDAEAGRAALESVQRQLRLLDEGLHRLEERGSGLGGRLDRVGDDVTGTAQRVERLSARLDALGGLADRVAELAQRTGPDELPPRLARLESALQGLDARLDQAEQDLGGERERGERDGARLQSLVGLAERVEDLRAATAPLEQRLQGQARALAGLEPIPDRVRQMEDLFQPLDARVCAQEHGLVGLQQRLGGVDRGLEELARHVDAGAERAAQQEERFNALAAEVRQNGVDLSSLVTRLDALGVPVHSLERELQETARRVQALGEGREHLAGSLAAIQDELNQLGAAMETGERGADRLRRELRGLGEVVSGVRSGSRVLAWSGVVGAIVLVALSLAGYWFTGYRMSVDREAVAERLAGMDRHIAANVGDHGRKRLSLDVADLNQQLRALQGRVDDLAAAGAPGAWEQDKANLTQALDDLNGRLAKLEEQSAAAPARAAVASAPAPAAAPAAADTKPAGPAAKTPQVRRPVSGDDAWRKAQAAGHYTVQVVGASEQRSLRNFARRHHLQKDSAWFRTEFRGRTWLELFHGTYATRAAANEAAQALGRALGKASKPWPRPLPRKGELHPLD